jgi:tetratricopeptide (TPR) repeat protein
LKTKAKTRLFKGIAILIPVILLAVIELALRCFGYGHDTSLFIQYPDDPSLIVLNKYASLRYFNDTTNATKGYIEPFKRHKDSNTLRLVVLGESTGAGYPYFHNGSFHRWLQYRLSRSMPGRNVEVLNFSLTAINSYTVLDFSKQLSEINPDAVMIYVGHNEYYGALGVGSTSNLGSNRFVVHLLTNLRRLRLVQLIDNFLAAIRGSANTSRVDMSENLMKRMVARQSIVLGSKEYYQGVNQFKENLSETCEVLQNEHIPVFISTLVSNEKDLPPLASDNGPTSANAYFSQGQAALKKGDFKLAKVLFLKAKDADLLRFRAPEAMDSAIFAVAKAYGNVIVVDTRQEFESKSAGGILGHETLLEHVHPNLFGYALLSDAFYNALKKKHIFAIPDSEEMSFPDLLKKMPLATVDSLTGAYQIMMLKAGWPFNQKLPSDFKIGNDFNQKVAGMLAVNRVSWNDAMVHLYQFSMQNHDTTTAKKVTEALVLDNPRDTKYAMYAARLNFEVGDYRSSEFYFHRCYQIDNSFENANNLYLFYLKSDQPQKAVQWIDTCSTKNAGGGQWQTVRALVDNIAVLKTQVGKAPSGIAVSKKIAAIYQELGEQQLAGKYNR